METENANEVIAGKIAQPAPAESAADKTGLNGDLKTVSESAKVKKKRRKIHEFDSGNDMKFRGPLSYRSLRILAWLCVVISQVGAVLSIVAKVDTWWGGQNETLITVLSSFGSLTFPFFLLAAFAIILNVKDGYKKLIVFYSIFAGFICLLFIVAYYHYAVGLLVGFSGDAELSEAVASTVLYTLSKGGYLSVNIFVDLSLCTLFMYFINYHPKKYFQGKKIKWFRLFALIPIAYELVSIYLKTESILGNLVLPIPIYPLLTTKPPMTFLFFIALVLFIKRRERAFIKRGRTLDEYSCFLKSNANSFHFSLFTSIAILITALLDLAFMFLAAEILSSTISATDAEIYGIVYGLGMGKSFFLIFTIPFVMLFSYTKTHKNASIDRAIPLAGMAVVVFIFFEGIFQLIKYLPSIQL